MMRLAEQLAHLMMNTYEAVELIRGLETISISQLQRKFRIDITGAARLIDDLAQGFIGPQDGSKLRQVFVQAD